MSMQTQRCFRSSTTWLMGVFLVALLAACDPNTKPDVEVPAGPDPDFCRFTGTSCAALIQTNHFCCFDGTHLTEVGGACVGVFDFAGCPGNETTSQATPIPPAVLVNLPK